MLSRLVSKLKPVETRRWFSSMPAVADVVDTWSNPAAVLHGINDLRFEEFALPAQVKHGSVRVQMKSVGICGSDVAFLKKVRSTIKCDHCCMTRCDSPLQCVRHRLSRVHRNRNTCPHSHALPAGSDRPLHTERPHGDWPRVCRVRVAVANPSCFS